MRQVVDIMGVNIDSINNQQVIDRILEFIKESTTHMIFTPNSEIIYTTKEDYSLKNILNSADLLIPDGIGVVWASRILGNPIKERITGFDTMSKLFDIGKDGTISFYLFGSSQDVIEKAVENLKNKYPKLNILGFHNGYFDSSSEDAIVNEINSLNPDVLLVALGAPKQEKWIYKNKDALNAKVCMGVGGCFDVIAGKVNRAPLVYQKLGLEWFYRFVKQPSRFFRMLKLPQFGLYIIFIRIKNLFN